MLTMLVRDLCLEDADLVFDDPARGVVRRILRRGAGIAAYLLAGAVRASEALLNWADTGIPPGNIGQVLMGRSPSKTAGRRGGKEWVRTCWYGWWAYN